MNNNREISRFNFEKVDISQIQTILSDGSLDALRPAEREYYNMMEMVRGLRARMRFTNGRAVSPAGIIKLLKSEPYHLSDWMARQIYQDSINFFYSVDNIRPRAFANMYAEWAENWAKTAMMSGNIKEARSMLKLAAECRGCFKKEAEGIPEEILGQKKIDIYTADREDLGVPAIDRKELEEFIDSIPEIPVITRNNLKEDARIKKMDLKNRMIHDIEEFSEEDE